MDARNLDFPKKCFNMIVEKATLDLMIAAAPSQAEGIESVRRVLVQCLGVLKERGCFFSVSHVPPAERVPYLSLNHTAPWKIECVRLVKTKVPFLPVEPDPYFYIYMCTLAPTSEDEM